MEPEENVLICPACDGMYLHHTTIKVYDRVEDHGPTMVFVINGRKIFRESPGLSANPSGRRSAVGASFYCENCNYLGELTIAQHKGRTYLEWRSIGESIVHSLDLEMGDA